MKRLPFAIRGSIWLLLECLALPVFAQVCGLSESPDRSIYERNFQLKISEDANLTIIQERELKDEAQGYAAGLFAERPSSANDLAVRVNQFLSANQDIFRLAENDLNFLQNIFRGQNPPRFVAVDMSSEELAYLRKAAAILSLHQYAQVNALGTKDAHWDDLLLITVGPAVYLRVRKPELFHGTTLMAMDDRALNPFHDALNWQGKKTPEWMEKAVGRATINETGDRNDTNLAKLPEGDGVFLLSRGELPAISSAFVSACQKSHSRPTPEPPGKTEQGNNIPTTKEETTAVVEQSRSVNKIHESSRRMDIYRATKETDPEVARKNAMTRHALAYSWVTTDGAGHRWVHIRPIHYSQRE